MNDQFFEDLFNDSKGWLAATFIEAGTKRVQNKYYDLADLTEFYRECEDKSRQGWNCYFVPATMAKQGRTKQDFKESSVVWMDYDQGTALPKFTDPLPTHVVESSPGKYHVYWKLDKPENDATRVEAINRALIKQYGADKSGVDCTQLLRVPDTLNYKYDQALPVAIVSSYPFSYSVETFPTSFLQGNHVSLIYHKQLSLRR